MDPVTEPQPSQHLQPLNPAPSSAADEVVKPTDQPIVKKRRFNRPPKLSIEKLTSTDAISSIVAIGRATSSEYREGKQAQMLSTVIRRAIRWANSVAPHHSPAQFAVEARAISSKREVRSYLSNVRLAQLRGAHLGEEEEDVDVDDHMEIEPQLNKGIQNGKEENAAGAVAADVPDIDEMMLMQRELEQQPQPTSQANQEKVANPPPQDDDGWDEEDMFMDGDDDPLAATKVSSTTATTTGTKSSSQNGLETGVSKTNSADAQKSSLNDSEKERKGTTADKQSNENAPSIKHKDLKAASSKPTDLSEHPPSSKGDDVSDGRNNDEGSKGDKPSTTPVDNKGAGENKASDEKDVTWSDANRNSTEKSGDGVTALLESPKHQDKPQEKGPLSDQKQHESTEGNADDSEEDEDEIQIRRKKPSSSNNRTHAIGASSSVAIKDSQDGKPT